jgi:chromosome segregation ATPase
MNTRRTGQIASIIEKRRPLAKKIAGVEANLKSLESALRDLEKHRNQLLTQVDDLNVSGRLKELNFATTQLNIITEVEAIRFG